LWWSLTAFEKCPSVSSIVLVAPAGDLPVLRARARRWKIKKLKAVVSGGKTRADSVRAGLRAVGPEAAWIAVHDAVRPLVTVDVIEKTLAEARRFGAAIAAVPSKDTVKLSHPRGHVRATPERASVWLAQTPQVFARRLLEDAHRRGRRRAVTDDAQLVERLGIRVRLVEASPENIKVTLPLDLVLAKALIKKQFKKLLLSR